MKIRFLEDTNIRNAPRLTGDPPVGVMFKGSEIEVEPDMARGDAVENNDRWYHDRNGWYYWSGRAESLEEEPAPGNTLGGALVWPSSNPPPSSTVPSDSTNQSAVPVLPSPPSSSNDDLDTGDQTIPEGETRLVPSLEVLLEMERRNRAGIGTLPKPAPELEPMTTILASRGIIEEAAPRSVEPPAVAHTEVEAAVPTPPPPPDAAVSPQIQPLPPVEETSAPWRNPMPQKLNWGVQSYLIARDWWQRRQLTGRSVSIAILSTGIEPSHPDLVNLEDTYQYPGDTLPMMDWHGLGTQAAAVAAGSGQTVFGVAPEARLLIAKLGEQDHAITPDNLIGGLRWAIDSQADIVAMLVDFPDLSVGQLEEIQLLLKAATDQNIWLVAPAGTSESKKPESRYPARLTGVLSVGAHDRQAHRSSFSARSYDLDLLAPGEGLITSTPHQQVVVNQKSTSIAAAFVAGFLALIRQWYLEHGLTFTSDVAYELLRQTAASPRPFNKGEDVEYGHGILNPIEVLKKLDHNYTGAD